MNKEADFDAVLLNEVDKDSHLYKMANHMIREDSKWVISYPAGISQKYMWTVVSDAEFNKYYGDK